ncbi:MAG: sulfatase [Candidatus Aminicenantales bacterium]
MAQTDILKTSRPNIVVFVLDALRARNLGCYGSEEGLTPRIDELAANGILFENAYCCWNTTDQSLTSIFTGMYPRSHGLVHHGDKVTSEDRLTFDTLRIPMLAEILKPLGYRTYAVDWMGRWFRKGFEFYGYDLEKSPLQKITSILFARPYVHIKYVLSHIGLLGLYAKKRPASLPLLLKGLRDVWRTFRFSFELARVQDGQVVTGLAEKLIQRAGKKPFFLFLHYWDTHTPYNCPRKFVPRKKRRSSPKSALVSRYHGAVRYVDHQVGRVIDTLREEGLLEKTLIILTSDHGESLTEHGIFFDHHGLYEATTHVPLILHAPALFPDPRRIPSLVQHVDLLPTILDLLKARTQDLAFDGASLLPLVRGEAQQIRDSVFVEESYVQRKIGLRTEDRKFMMAPDGKGFCRYCQTVHGGKEELYHLAEDPEERINLALRDPLTVEKMRRMTERMAKALDEKRAQRLAANSTMTPPPSLAEVREKEEKEEKRLRKKLASLGYTDGSSPDDT